MSYTPPLGSAANFSWQGATSYNQPAGTAANFTWPSPRIECTLAAGVPAATLPPLQCAATGFSYSESNVTTGVLGAGLQPPNVGLLALASAGRTDIRGGVLALLPPPHLGLALDARENAAVGDMVVVLPPAVLPPLSIATAGIDYDQALPDAIGPGVFAHHLAQRDDHVGLAVQQQPMLPARTPTKAHQTTADPLHVSTTARQQQMQPASRASAQRAQPGIPLGNGRSIGHADTLRQHRAITARVQHGIPLANGTHSQHQERIPFRHRLRSDQTHAEKVSTTATARAQQARKTATPLYVGHQHAAKLPVGWWQATYPWPEPPTPELPANLRFCRLADGSTALVFGCPKTQQPETGTVVVPVRRTYIVLNNVSLVRASDGLPIPALSLSISLDAQSWTWGFDASVPLQAQSLVEPTNGPVELIATINGSQFRLLAESISRDRAFAQASVKISGRGRNAVLDDPYAAVMSFENTQARTAAQLADDALLNNGVNVGQATIGQPWVVQWGLTDWLVPAGAWVHNGTHISALNTIAQSAGGYLQPHRTDAVIKVVPRYPVAPWNWGDVTPDFELPSAVTTRESIQWADKPKYNRVFVSGQQVGVMGQVTRAGTAGDVVAASVVDPLITHADAARQRGVSILGDTGRIASVSLSLPVLQETGIIDIGKFVRYTDGSDSKIGLVRSNSVSAGAFGVDLMQNLVLETHA